MSEKAAIQKQLRIKTGVARRLFKERKTYQTEEEDQKREVDRLEAEGGEEWYIKNGRKMLDEARKMIADSEKRLGNAVQELRDLVVSAEQDPALENDEELLKAKEVLEEVSV